MVHALTRNFHHQAIIETTNHQNYGNKYKYSVATKNHEKSLTMLCKLIMGLHKNLKNPVLGQDYVLIIIKSLKFHLSRPQKIQDIN